MSSPPGDKIATLHEVPRPLFLHGRMQAAQIDKDPLSNRFDRKTNRTSWYSGERLLGQSEGPIGTQKRYWLVLELTPDQQAGVAERLANDSVTDDNSFATYLARNFGLSGDQLDIVLVERSRRFKAARSNPFAHRAPSLERRDEQA